MEGTPFKGYIDEDKMFNMSLNITDIENIYDYGTITAPDYVSNFSVSINSPVNNSYTYDHTPDFNFTVNGTETSYDCDLVINGTYYGFNVSSMNNTVTTITANASIVVGDYVFNITCTQNDTTNYSASVYFDIRDYVIAGTIKYSNLTLVNNSGEQTFIEIINQSNNASIAWTSANEVGAWSYDSVPMGVYGVHARTDTIISGGASNPWINVSQVNGWFT